MLIAGANNIHITHLVGSLKHETRILGNSTCTVIGLGLKIQFLCLQLFYLYSFYLCSFYLFIFFLYSFKVVSLLALKFPKVSLICILKPCFIF